MLDASRMMGEHSSCSAATSTAEACRLPASAIRAWSHSCPNRFDVSLNFFGRSSLRNNLLATAVHHFASVSVEHLIKKSY